MPVARFRRRPPEVDAVQYTGGNAAEVAGWCGGRLLVATTVGQPTDAVLIRIGWSQVAARPGDYIVKETLPRGEVRFYPVRREVFEWAWEPIEG